MARTWLARNTEATWTQHAQGSARRPTRIGGMRASPQKSGNPWAAISAPRSASWADAEPSVCSIWLDHRK